jgi:hypothetical protein
MTNANQPQGVQRHPTTSAAVATTPVTATPRRAPTPAEINRQQQEDAARATHERETRETAARRAVMAMPPTNAPVAQVELPLQSQMLVGQRSDEAFERNLQELGGAGNPTLTPNLSEGDFRMPGGEVVNVEGNVFVLHADEARKGVIKFNGEGNPPTKISVCLYEDAQLPTREELGDLDQSLWETDRFSGQPMDPWQPEIVVPNVSTAPDGTIYELTSRSPTALFAIRNLLDRYHRNPQRKKGLVPLITMKIGTYPNKKLGRDMYKPIYTIVGWVNKDGSPPEKKPDRVTSGPADFQDKIPF